MFLINGEGGIFIKFNKWGGIENDQTWIFSNFFLKKVLIDPNDLHFYQNAPWIMKETKYSMIFTDKGTCFTF